MNNKILLAGMLIFFRPVVAEASSVFAEVNAHVCIGDYAKACYLCKKALAEAPFDLVMQKQMLKVAADGGRFSQAFAIWQTIKQKEPLDIWTDFDLIEALAWSAMKERSQYSDAMCMEQLKAHVVTHDAKAVELLLEHLKSPSAALRAFAASLSGSFRDLNIRKMILQRLDVESHPMVREALFSAIEQMKMKEAIPSLKAICSSVELSQEEKNRALTVWLLLEDEHFTQLIETVSLNFSPTIRVAALEKVFREANFTLLSQLEKYIEDNNLFVRLIYLRLVMALCQAHELPANLSAHLDQWLESDNPLIALQSAVLLSRINPARVASILDKWFSHANRQVVLSVVTLFPLTCGMNEPAIGSILKGNDPYIRINYLYSLLQFRDLLPSELEMIRLDLTSIKELVCIEPSGFGPFPILKNSMVPHHPYIAGYPELVDQMARMHILNQLFIRGDLAARDTLAELLHSKQQLKGFSAYLLWGEGDFFGAEILKTFLNDPDEEVACEAALFLAMQQQDEGAVSKMIECYPKVRFELKEAICKALGQIGSKEAIAFLLERLQDPHQKLRQTVASSLIIALYH